ncbi:MAG: hypothetical protein AAGJ40_13670 [Planctomycetota bacterium]
MPNHSNSLSLLDILAAIFRYRWRAAFTFIALMVGALAIILLVPPKFESETKIFVRLGRGSVTMDTAATTGPTVALQESRETEMNSIVDMLESRQLHEAVVRSIGFEPILKKYATAEIFLEDLADWIREWLPESGLNATESELVEKRGMTAEQIGEQKQVEEAVKYLAENIRVKSPKKSTSVTITVRARTPWMAQTLAQSMLNQYERIHLDAYRSRGSFGFFEANFDDQDSRVRDLEAQLNSTKDEMNLLTIDGQQSSLQSQITMAQTDVASTWAEILSVRANLSDLESKMAALPTEIATAVTSGIANDANDQMRSQLYDLELRESELVAKYKDSHPVLKKLREQVRSARDILARQDSDRQHSTMAPNPIRQDLKSRYVTTQATLAGLEAKHETLVQRESDLETRLQRVNECERTIADLERRIRISEAHHFTYAKKLEEARIQQALDDQAISNVSVVQPPTLTLKKVSPKRSLLGVIAIMFSGLSSLFVAVASDRRADWMAALGYSGAAPTVSDDRPFPPAGPTESSVSTEQVVPAHRDEDAPVVGIDSSADDSSGGRVPEDASVRQPPLPR